MLHTPPQTFLCYRCYVYIGYYTCYLNIYTLQVERTDFVINIVYYSKVSRLVCILWMSADWLHKLMNYKQCPWSVYKINNYEELYSDLQRLLLSTAPEYSTCSWKGVRRTWNELEWTLETSAVSKGAHFGVSSQPLRGRPQRGDMVKCGHLRTEGSERAWGCL